MATTKQSTIPAGYKVRNVSNHAAFGIHYTIPDSDTLFGLTCLRWTEHLTLDSRVNGTWYSSRVVNPERFTNGYAVETPKQFAAVVDAWFASFSTKTSDEATS